ncbi:hypothetical protein GCM10022212_38050 [Actimicrobium antarcticum]|uniref:Uncharacterized protein n=1 Tax=Actimicrobium antarcticum TaxID=1051899 RepID=A0ABP7U2E0_9BURK
MHMHPIVPNYFDVMLSLADVGGRVRTAECACTEAVDSLLRRIQKLLILINGGLKRYSGL